MGAFDDSRRTTSHRLPSASKAGYVTRHPVPLRGQERLHHVHHFGIVGPLTFSIAAHRLDQIFIPLAGQPRRRQATSQVLLMTSLAYSHYGGRRRGGGASGARRPVLFREISCCGPEFCRREGCCHPHHDLVVAISTMEVMQLLYEIIFLLTPDDRSGCTSGYAVRAVAGVANEQLGAEDRLGLSGISRRGPRGHLNGMLNGICRRGH